jgi:serine phosphatase RsbU (regulator of sigma subunit)
MQEETRFGSSEVGGDFVVFALREPRRLAVVIGDACGHGPSAARLLPMVLPSVHAFLRSNAPPSRLLVEVNRESIRDMPLDRFVTAAAFELDVQAGTLTASSAGHVPALVRRAGGGVAVVGRASGPPLGLVADCPCVDEHCRLGRGDVVVFMTDGVLEALETDLLAMATLRKLLARAPRGRGALHRSLVKLLDGCSVARGADDMTLVSLEVVADVRRPAFTEPALAANACA